MDQTVEKLLNIDNCRELAHFCGLPEPIQSALRAAITSHRDNVQIHQLLQDCLDNIDQSRKGHPLIGWPDAESNPLHALVYCLLLLDLAGRMRRHYRQLRIDPGITRQTVMAKVATPIKQFWEINGVIGARSDVFNYLDWYLGPMPNVRLGTFSYEARPWGGFARVFKSRKSGQLKLLAEHGDYFDEDGRRMQSDMDCMGCFCATLDLDDAIRGYPICPQGLRTNQIQELDPDEWRVVLQKGDPVLQMHIPFDTDLSLSACRESFLAAINFYQNHFPEYGATFFACGSWIHSPDLRKIISPPSNLLKLQDAVYLMQNAADCQSYKYIFGFSEFHPQTAPRSTRLQRGLLNYLEQGNIFHKCAMILPFSEVEGLAVR